MTKFLFYKIREEDFGGIAYFSIFNAQIAVNKNMFALAKLIESISDLKIEKT